jgi:hypothetical protein
MFVLYRQVSGVEVFWTGGIRSDGQPETTTSLDDAAQFCTSDSASRCAGNYKQLDDWTVAERFPLNGRRH